jgi:hypothetical protein
MHEHTARLTWVPGRDRDCGLRACRSRAPCTAGEREAFRALDRRQRGGAWQGIRPGSVARSGPGKLAARLAAASAYVVVQPTCSARTWGNAPAAMEQADPAWPWQPSRRSEIGMFSSKGAALRGSGCSVKDYGPVTVKQHAVLRVPGHRARENLRLDVAARLREPLGRQAVIYPDHVLLDNRAFV